MKRIATALGLALAFVAFGAVAPVAAQDLDPVGDFEWSLDFDGQMMSGTMSIEGEDGDWTGLISSDMGEMAITAIEVDGNVLTFAIDMPEAYISFMLEFEGDDFTGEFNADGMGGGAISGSRSDG